jgi:RNA polymerase sigma-70 factor (ECF subfamily)
MSGAGVPQAYDDPDGGLIARFKGGDSSAFAELVRKYERSIVALVRRYVTVEEDAKDLAQRTFVRVLERIDSFHARSSFRTWLYRVAINLAVDHARGDDSGSAVPLEDDVAFTSSLGTEKLVAAEVWRKVSARLAELPPRQRLVVELRVFHDLSFEEIGALVDSSEDAAKANYHHGVKRLRSILARVPSD